MWSQRKPCMAMAMVDNKRKPADFRHSANERYLAAPPIDTVAKQMSLPLLPSAPMAATPMFSHNMSHLRGAKPCGSCGGR